MKPSTEDSLTLGAELHLKSSGSSSQSSLVAPHHGPTTKKVVARTDHSVGGIVSGGLMTRPFAYPDAGLIKETRAETRNTGLDN